MIRMSLVMVVLLLSFENLVNAQELTANSPVNRDVDNACGIKCLQFILNEHFHRQADLMDLVRIHDWSHLQKGVTVGELLEAFHKERIEAKTVSIDPYRVISSDRPSVFLWKNRDSEIGHFVVLLPHANSESVEIWDNGMKRTMPTWEFCRESTGVAIVFSGADSSTFDDHVITSFDHKVAFVLKIVLFVLFFGLAFDWLFLRKKATVGQCIITKPNETTRSGFTLIELIVVIAIISIVISLLLAGVQKVRSQSARITCQNQFRQVALSTLHCHDQFGAFPPGLSVDADNKKYKYMGWTARILPFVEQGNLWNSVEKAFRSDPDQDEFYGWQEHLPILKTRVPIYQCPSDQPSRIELNPFQPAFTWILGNSGTSHQKTDGVFFKDSHVKMSMITDGTSNTILMGERPPSNSGTLGWWYRGWGQNRDGSAEMVLGVREINILGPGCPTGPYSFTEGTPTNRCSIFHFWSLHRQGANFAFADGSVRFLTYSVDSIIDRIATRSGGETVPPLE